MSAVPAIRPALEQLSQEFADRGVAYLGINANQQEFTSEMASYGRTCAINFPLLKDPGNVVADQFAAKSACPRCLCSIKGARFATAAASTINSA